KLKPEIRDEGDVRVYLWKHSHLEPSAPSDKKLITESEPARVQLTTFQSWEEVGSWWATLAASQAAVTPAIQDKAKKLTAGLSSDEEKARAIYDYVSLKFRYISISFGEGRFRPHSAEEVLANQYGDCKDKHTLLAALLKAAGIPAWPVLIGAGIKFESGIPLPAQFNHVITVLPQNGNYVWLDTTAEVAPFGLLNQVIRDEQALVMPTQGKPFLMKTPADPPFASSKVITVKSSLAADGTLNGRFDFQFEGDSAVLLRAGFRRFAPTQWQSLAQQISYGLGFAGDVSGVDVNGLDAIEKPFHYSYDYSRKNYSDWSEHKITPPMPPLRFGPGDEAEKPKESVGAGTRGTWEYQATMKLPKGFSIELPQDSTLTADFADYSAHYSVKDGTLYADRKMVVKQSKIAPEQWEAYQKFGKALRTDENKYLVLSNSGGGPSVSASKSNPEAEELMRRASQSLTARNLNEVRDLLAQVELRNPKQSKLWSFYAYLAATSGDLSQSIADYRKEIQFHPDEIAAYRELTNELMQQGRRDEAIEAWRGALSVMPQDQLAATRIASLMMQAKRYGEIPAVLEKPIAAAPDRYNLQALRVEALLRAGQKDQGIADAERIAKATSEPIILNDMAYALLDTGSAIELAQEWAQKALSQTEQYTAKLTLASFETKDLAAVNGLAAEWDTVGWVYFKLGDMAKAKKYLEASWQLNQHAAVADHLGQIYDKQGRREAAIHMWRLALAVNSKYDEAREQLRNAGVPVSQPVTMGKNGKRIIPVFGGEELGKLRTFGVPSLPKQTGSAEFFLLLSSHGIEDVRFINGLDTFNDAGHAIQTAKYEFPFPDAGIEKIIRRGILSCSVYTTPSCQFTMFLPSTTTVNR
ncbi:MAG TPA: transglutaminase domain-containing protein, partial [Bryobacteraceae bacterium]|nr:transglutaminase domain-containing protein [Bryobacteraceae bacterium]